MPKNTKNICLILFIMLVFLILYTRQTTLVSPISLTSCKLGVRPALCGTVQVYENRSAKKGRKIDIKVVVIKAISLTPASDPIFFLAGGPGGSAIEAGQKQQFSLSLSDTHDLVFVDQRGTGGSNPGTISQGYPDFSGLTPEQINVKTIAKAWEYTILRIVKMDPQFYTTSVPMDDLDEVRDALGYDKINLVGGSYGATAAQYYLRQHETHVDRKSVV
jgi:pimeloyl-ACP methyl ester carboxylesterase